MKVPKSKELVDLQNIKNEFEAVNSALKTTHEWHSRLELLERVNKLLMMMKVAEFESAS